MLLIAAAHCVLKKVLSVFFLSVQAVKETCDAEDTKRRRLAESRSCWDEPACTGGRARWGFVIK